jgi:hypothetical protein
MSLRNDVSVAPRRKGLHKATRNERSNIDALRVLVNGKGNQRQDLFLSERDLKTFLSILSEHKVRYSFHLYVYALMKNHFHLLLGSERFLVTHWSGVRLDRDGLGSVGRVAFYTRPPFHQMCHRERN